MTLQKLSENIKAAKIGDQPVVVIPLRQWRAIEMFMEEYEMANSRKYLESISASRREARQKKLYEFKPKTGKFTKVQK